MSGFKVPHSLIQIDANLDAQYRTAVACELFTNVMNANDLTRFVAMIHSLSSTAQFITTTFRPEMLVTSDKFYGVLFNNQKISSIRSIKREEAMEFVDQVWLSTSLNLIPISPQLAGGASTIGKTLP